MPLRDVSEQVRNKWRRRSEPMLSSMKQEQPPMTIPPQEVSQQEATMNDQQQDPTTNKKKPPTTNDFGPNPDTLVNGIGEYHFVSQLGEGKFSKVMLAQHYLTGDKFAIKMIDKRVFDDRVMSRLVREIGVMEALNHPSIARLYETFETTNTLYLVMEYIPGVNLEEHLKARGGQLKEDDARVIFRQVVAAVDYCHQKWVVHRDLKAPNIILTKDNQVHLVDFGLSNRFGHQRLRTICGSMLYYSPEIINGKKYIGPEVDCWCLGICLFRMVAGFEAFVHAKTVGELRKDILNRNYPMPSHFSDGLKRTIQKCLSTDRRRRSSLGNALQGDPWLNDGGQYEDLFSDGRNYHAALYQFAVPSSMSIDNISLEARQQERDQQQRQFLRDMEEEKRMGYKVQKTIIHHAYNASFYYTGHGRREERSLLEPARAALYREILSTMNRISLSSVHSVHFSSFRAPMNQLLRKWKRPDPHVNSHPITATLDYQELPMLSSSISTDIDNQPSPLPTQRPSTRPMKKSSTLNLSQLYQRTKDKTFYFSIQANARAVSSTTVPSLSSSSNTALSSLDTPQPTSTLPSHTALDEMELVLLLRSVCELLGVTYLHESRSQLSCMFTLCDYKADDHHQQRHKVASPTTSPPTKPIPRKSSLKQLFSAASTNGSTPSLLKKKSFTNNALHPKNTVDPVSMTHIPNDAKNGSEWWLQQLQRLSLPHSTLGQQQQQQTLRHSSSAQLLRSSASPPGRFGLRGKASFDNFFQRKQDPPTSDNSTTSPSPPPSTDGTVVFSAQVYFVPSRQKENARLLALQFTKTSGSAKVYKLVTGWITSVLQSKHNQT